MLGQGQGILSGLAEQQVALAQVEQFFALGQAQLQLQGDAAVGHLDLQGMAERTHQFAAADGMGQVILTAVLAMEQHQAAAVVEGVQFASIERRGLVQAIAISLQQIHQARARQASELLLGAQLDGQHGALLRGVDGKRGNRCRCSAVVAQIGEGVVIVRWVAWAVIASLVAVVKALIVQVAHLEGRLVIVEVVLVGLLVMKILGLRLGLGFFRDQAHLQLTRQVADFVLTAGAGRRIVRVA
ncbi:hypothetical protein D3C84_613180 [compost metagenome]